MVRNYNNAVQDYNNAVQYYNTVRDCLTPLSQLEFLNTKPEQNVNQSTGYEEQCQITFSRGSNINNKLVHVEQTPGIC
jgi:hypothetical protein